MEPNENNELLRNTIDSSLDMIQVFRTVRDDKGEITDFVWILNNNASEKFYGDVIGKSLLTLNPGVIKEGIFDTFKMVVETGQPNQSVRHYVHEQFDGWFLQSAVKQGDWLTTTTKDITQLKRAEQNILEKQALLESVLNNTESSIMLLKPIQDKKGDIIDFEYEYANDPTLKSVSRDSLLGKRMIEEFPEVKDSDLFKKYVTVAETGEGFKGEVNIDPYGYPVWAQVFALKFADGILVTYFDISERKRTDQQLVESKELVQTVFNVTINPIAYHKAVRDHNNKIIDFEFQLENQKAREYSLEDRTGQRYSDAYPGIKDTVVFEKYCNVVESGNNLDTEVEVSLRGRNHWFHLMAAKLGDGLVATAINITERKQAQDEILRLKDDIAQHAEDKYRTLFNAIDEGFALMELVRNNDGLVVDLIYREVNEAFKRFTGWQEAVGVRGSELMPRLESSLLEQMQLVADTGNPFRKEDYVINLDRWYDVHYSAVGAPGSNVIVAVFNDTTDRKQQEMQQQFLLEFSDALRVETSEDAIANQSLRMIADFLKLDRCYIALYNLDDDKADVLFQTGNETIPPMPDKIRLSDFPDALKVIFDSTLVINDLQHEPGLSDNDKINIGAFGFNALVAATLRKHKNIPLWCIVAVSSKPRVWLQSHIFLLEEITERTWAAIEKAKADEMIRYSEQRFQSIANLIPDLLWDSEPNGSTNWCNYSWLAYTGQKFEEAIGSGWINTIHPDDRQGSAQRYAEAVTAGKYLHQEHRIRRYDGQYRWFVVSASPVTDDNGKVIKMYGAATDIHDRKLAEQQALANERRQTFLLQLSDAIRTVSDPVKIQRTAARLLRERLKAGWCYYNEFDETQKVSKVLIDDVRDGLPSMVGVHDLSVVPEFLDHVRAGNILKAPDIAVSGLFNQPVTDHYASLGMRSALGVPLVKDDRLLAVLLVADTIPREWTPEEIELLKEVAERTWNAIVRAQAETELKQVQSTYLLKLEQQVRDRTAELLANRDQLQLFLDTTLVQMSILEAVRDSNGVLTDLRIKAVNQELEKETGRNDLVGKLYATEYPGIKETGLFGMIIKAIETGEPQSTEYFYPHDGFQKWFSCMFVKLNDGVVATNMDISARKQAEEERFKNYVLLHQSEAIASMGSWDYEPLTGKFTWSDGMYHLFDLEIALEIAPEIYLKYTTENGRMAAESVVEHIRNGDTDFEETLELNISGKTKVLNIKGAIVKGGDGKIERVLGVDLDISATKAAEEKIKHMEVEQQLEIFQVTLRTQEEERRRISESLHNGLGQLLYGIKMSLSQLSIKLAKENEADFNEARRYTSELLSDAIRDTRKISHELMPTVLNEFGLEAAIKDICSLMRDGTKFNCIVNLNGIKLDKYMQLAIFRTLQELMTNIVKHAKATAALVEVNADDKNVYLRVYDNGEGIDKTKHGKGGIGLASIKSKVDLLNGNVEIISGPAQGTDVKIVLPYKSQVEN
ncbi:PAS domain S-box protein [Mucilaginibacter pallidiroseus]|uniref:Oxygen sensor histidine kinase NreB n=1 Tax=Mucilaginibacter pallidiroseus TaxID=2599295 RepID=A0A563UHU6_9SPHI|nr:PAS domain S-box protein [Mucilaginibacter pallidiroseus]TWR30935.1 PAS domain S-box protein [Mucilaginibacter pallidiroseus]